MDQLTAAIAAAKQAGQTGIDGDTAFRLYDTFGFPMEMTRELVTAAGIGVDEAGFKALLDAQRQRGRAAAKFSQDAMRFGQLYADLHEKDGLASTFTGYTDLASDAAIRSIVIGGQRVDEAREGQDVEIVLDRTPFYPEGGGQVGDRGAITTSEGRARVGGDASVRREVRRRGPRGRGRSDLAGALRWHALSLHRGHRPVPHHEGGVHRRRRATHRGRDRRGRAPRGARHARPGRAGGGIVEGPAGAAPRGGGPDGRVPREAREAAGRAPEE